MDGEDLLDDVLTAPPRARTATPTNDDEVRILSITFFDLLNQLCVYSYDKCRTFV